MKTTIPSILLLSIFFVQACTKPVTTLSYEDEVQLLHKGDSITAATQAILMANVAKAINLKGVAGAVDFCNVRAIPLTDSMSHHFVSEIHRVSDKNRNPDNALRSRSEQKAWETMKITMLDNKVEKKHFVEWDGKSKATYYKAIPLAMETCLKCHGKEIAPDVAAIIKTKYPNDKATGYSKGELRGMWKVSLNIP